MKIIAANLKANHTPSSTQHYLHNLESLLNNIFTNLSSHSYQLSNELNPNKLLEILIFPNMACLNANTFTHFNIGAQNIYPVKNGAFTGEIGLEVLDSLGIHHILLGHSERRKILGESLAFIQEKFNFCTKTHKKIMLCVGEDSLMQDSLNAMKSLFATQLHGIDLDYPLLSIAYEPVWAIGNNCTPTLEHITKVREILRGMGVKKCLYGGSVNANNCKEICAVTDGILVGSASLEVSNFAKIIHNVIF